MKTKLKRLTTSGVALILMVSMLLSTMMTAGAIMFSGTPGGGGSQNNTGGDPNGRYKVAAVDNHYQHIVGYRFSVVTEGGREKTDTTVKDVYLSQSSRGLACYSSALSTTIKRTKSEIRQDYETLYTFMTAYDENTSSSCLDSNLGLEEDIPLSPTGIEAWCKYNGGERLEALLIAAGVVDEKNGLDILDSTDRILVEPIFEVTLEHHLCALTVTEIAVYEYELFKTGYNNKYGRTYTERYGKTLVTYEEGKTFESIVKMTNRIYPNLLYEDGKGVPSSDSNSFWKGAPGEISGGIFLANGLGTFDGVSIASCIDLIEYGYGVAVVWDGNDIEETRVKLQYHPNGGLPSPVANNNNSGYDVSLAAGGLLTYGGVLIETIIPKGQQGTPEDWIPMDLTWDALGEESGKYSLNTALMWNTRADGSGKTLIPGTDYNYSSLVELADENGVVILYAIWDEEEPEPETPKQLIIKYHANGGTLGHDVLRAGTDGIIETPDGVDNTTTVSEGKTTTLGNWSNYKMTRDGYTLNEGVMWNSNASGAGQTFTRNTPYSYDTLVKLDTDGDGVVILYAVWEKEGTESEEPDKIYLRYHTNGGTVSKSGLKVESGYVKNLFGNGYVFFDTTVYKGKSNNPREYSNWGLAKEGYILNENLMWNTKADGGGKTFKPSVSYSYDEYLPYASDGVVVLYAQWKTEEVEEPEPDPEPEEPEPEPDREYEYLYIKLHINGGEMEDSGDSWSYRLSQSGIITYKHRDYIHKLTVRYRENGKWYIVNESADLPTAETLQFIQNSKHFLGWNTKPDGTGASFSDGAQVSATTLDSYDKDDGARDNTVILYAQWYEEPDESSPIIIKVNCYVNGESANFPLKDAVYIQTYDESDSVVKKTVALTSLNSFSIEGNEAYHYIISARASVVSENTPTYYPIQEASPSTPLYIEVEEGEKRVYEYNIYYCTLSYDGNSPNGKKVTNVPATQYLLEGLFGQVSRTRPSLNDYSFLYWTVDRAGEGTRYNSGDPIVIVAPLVLYAQWLNAPSTVFTDLMVHTYVDDERISIRDLGFDVRTEQVVVVDGEECVVPRGLNNIDKGRYYAPLLSFGSYEWTYRVITTDENGVDWYLKADGSYTTTVTTLPTPTSQPTHRIDYYTVTYLPNHPADGDVGNMPEKQYALKGIEERLSTLTPTREDEYGFVNWNTQGDGKGTAYAKGVRVTLTAPLVLYAQWKKMMCELVFEAIVQGATSKQFVDDIPGAIWVETEEGNYPIGKNGTVTVTLPKGTKYRLRAIYETGGTVYPYTAKGNYEDTEFTLTRSFTHHGIYYYAINYYYGSTLLETPYRHYKLHGIDVKVSTDKPSIDFGTSLSRFLNVWDQPAVSMRYMPGAVYNLDQKGDLYAVTGVKVAYNVNGGTVGEGNYGVREDGLITRGGEIFFILLESEPPFTPIHYPYTFPLIPPQSNYEFVSWNEDSEGEGAVLVPGSVYGPVDFYSCDRTPDGEYAILYADWNPLINTVHFEATPEGYGTVELDGKPVSAVSGIPRGSEMYFENGQVVIEPIVNTPITVSYEDGSEESREGGKFVFRAVPSDPTSQYSYKHIGWEGVAPEIDRDITVIASFDREGTGNDIAIVGNPINGNPVLDSKFALSANIINNSDIDITPNMGIDAVVVITKNGSSEPVKTYRVENICVPKRGSNNATLSSVFIKKEGSHLEYILYDNSNLVFTEASVGSVSGTGIYRFYWYLDFSHAVGFTDADSSNNESAKNAFRAKSAVSESNPSRPVYSTDIPSSFKGKEAGESAVNTFSWSYYEYNPSAPLKFVKRTGEDGFKILLVATPENEGGLKKEERVVGLPDFTTRAGYGFSLHRSYSGLEAGDLNPSASAVFASKDSFGTLCALMYYPEFDYSTEAGKFSKLLVSAPNPKGDYRVYALSLPEYPDYQTNDINDKYAHYIPMWYPDGEYKTVSKYQGVWCPLGELTATVVQGEGRVVNGLTGKVDAEDSQEEMERMRMWTNKYTIQGSMYDDIYITH